MEERKLIPLEKLNLTNRFLFDEVLDDPETHQAVLNIIFGRQAPVLELNQTEKEKRLSPLIRSIRMDVYAEDEDGTVYNTEMQGEKKTDLAKRSRYYQALIDTGLLQPGIPDYNQLNDSYIIMINTFDMFGYGKYIYTFDSRCREVPDCILKDGAVRIFINTKGTNHEDISEEFRIFLQYLEDTRSEVLQNVSSVNLKKLHERVCEVKASEKVGVKYMQAWEEVYYAKQDGREELLIEQIKKKLAKGKTVEQISEELEEDWESIQEYIKKISAKEI